MALSSIIAIYFLFFAFSAFILLPFGVRTDEEAGTPKIAGQADSAPHRFNLKRHLLKSALLGLLLSGNALWFMISRKLRADSALSRPVSAVWRTCASIKLN